MSYNYALFKQGGLCTEKRLVCFSVGDYLLLTAKVIFLVFLVCNQHKVCFRVRVRVKII